MSANLNLTITSISQTFFNDEAVSVLVPGVLGQMQILANHEPIITSLKNGEIIVELTNKEKTKIHIESGVLEHSNNHTTILVESLDPTKKPE